MPDIPGNSTTTASISVGGTATGTLETIGDHDWFRITLTAGQSVTIFLDGTTLEDPYLRVRDAGGNLLFENDDISSGVNRDSQVSFTAPATGTYYIDVGAWNEGYVGDYTLSVTPYTPPPLATIDEIANQLIEGYWGGDDHHFNVTQGGSITVNLTALTPAGQSLAQAALGEWTEIIGVQFVQVTSGGQITFDDNQSGAFSDSNWSGGFITSSHINVSTQWLANYGTGVNTYSFQTYIHEIGHALGLGHAGNYNGEATYPYDASFQNDSWATSVMSYFSQTENTYFAGQGFTENFLLTPAMADILAMSAMYGLSTTTRVGDSTYTFGGSHSGAQTIFDAGGNDWIDTSGYAGSQLVNLNPGTFSNIHGDVGNVSIAVGVMIENAVGGSGSDMIVGNSDNNRLEGGAGSDNINGKGGADTMVGGLGDDAFVVDQSGDIIVEAPGEGDDRLHASASYSLGVGVSIDVMTTTDAAAFVAVNLTGNEYAQSLYGNSGDNILTGNGGSDYMVGLDGNDWYFVDTLDFIAEANGGGDDRISVPVSYILREGTEIETLIAAHPGSADPVDLTGNEYGQSLYGSQGVNSLNGAGGNDYLVGYDGNDFLNGGVGNDNMAGGQGNDIYYIDSPGDAIFEAAGEGDDLAVAFASFALGSDSHVDTIAAAGGGAINLTGNELAQSLYGNDGANVLTGNGGADYLVGRGGNDTFVLSSAAVINPASANIAAIGDYAAGEIIDVTPILAVAAGTDVVAGGYLRVTSNQVQVDLDGGGNQWTTLATINSGGSVTVRYLSGGTATNVTVARTSTTTTAAVAAAGLAAMPAAAKESDETSRSEPLADLGTTTATIEPTTTSDPALVSDSDTALAGDTSGTSDGSATSSMSLAGKTTTETSADALAAPEAAQPAALIQGTEVPAAADAAQTLVAPAVVMPSAEMLQAIGQSVSSLEGGLAGVQATAEVARVLFDALAGGDVGPNLDALLDPLAGQAGTPGLAPLAGHDGWAGGFAVALEAFSMEMFVVHHDALPQV